MVLATVASVLAPLFLAALQPSPARAVEASLLAELSRARGARDNVGTLERRNLAAPPLQADAFLRAPSVLAPSAPERRVIEPQPLAVFQPVPAATDRRALEPLAEAAAQQHGIAASFFKRLIRQESGYNPLAVSRAGAQGIAQFMPATAAIMGLDDPFNPAKALPKSAEHLADLQRRLGNEGLAAAAYNAGEGRVRAWLAGRSLLPLETQNYVLSITGRHAHEWAPASLAPMLAAAYETAKASRTLAGPTFMQFQSAEWQIGIKLMPEKSRLTALLSESQRSPSPHSAKARTAGPVKTAKPLIGEKALCAGMGGCIVAAVY